LCASTVQGVQEKRAQLNFSHEPSLPEGSSLLGMMPISAADVKGNPLISEMARSLMKRRLIGSKVSVFFLKGLTGMALN
jgi:hypothetical protein